MAGTKFRQVVSSFLALVFAVTLFPVSAFATFDENARIYATHYVDNNTVSPEINEKLCPTANLDPQTNPQWYASADSINLWVYSTDMTEDGANNGNSIPYVKDSEGNTYYLQKIEWRNSTDGSEATAETIMDSDAITTAVNNGSMQYSFAPSRITADPYNGSYELWAPDWSSVEYINYTAYYIYYYWTSTPPDNWGGEVTPLETYSIKYEANLPAGLTNRKIYPVRIDGSMDIGNTGLSETGLTEELAKYQTSVKKNLNFTIAQGGQYKDYLVFGDEGYYAFAGWQDESGNLYKTQKNTCTVQATSSLAGADNTITLTAQWELFYPTDASAGGQRTQAQAEAAQKLADAEAAWNSTENPNFKIDVLERDSGATSENVLLTQWSSLHGEPDFGEYSGDTVYLDETGTIHYRVSARMGGDVNSFAQDSAIQKFATFTLSLKVDKNLEFVSGTDGKASFTFNCPFLKPTSTNITDATISDTPDENGNYTITFSPSNITPDADGCMTITVTAEWISKVYPSTENTLRQPMTLDNLVFQLKDDVQTQGIQLQTNANITAKIDLTATGESRTLYQKARSLLTTSPNDAWANIFGEHSDPMAVALAAEFLNKKLTNYDLRRDTAMDGTASAVVVESAPVVIAPADITVYEGGDGGYDAVVDGSATTSSNSLPHPLFHITTPDGTDPADLTFRNGDKSWTVISDGNGYYHFSEGEGQDKVRVTYSYTDENGVKHTVTVDAFDPATMGDVYGQLTIELYPGENNLNDVTAKTKDGKTYQIKAGTGTLTVRAVEKETGATSDITEAAPTTKLKPNTATAVDLAGTTYTLNDTDVALPTDGTAKPSLLFDDIIESDGKPRVDALEDAVDTALGTTDGTRHYEAKYLDLVDANNGNAWISSSKGTDIYWGYPTGTDKNTNFTLVHFRDLHRDGTESGFDIDDINSDNVEVLTTKDGKIVNTDYGIKFHVAKGGFSPFVLVWETAAEEPDPGTDPNPGGGGSHSDPTGNLTISLGGNGGNEDFIFTVIFTDEDGDELENNFYYNGDYTGTIGSGDEITLTGGDKIVIRNLPEGTRYEVIIETADGYTATSTGAEGVIRTSGNEAAFSVTPTVVLADPSVTGVTRWLNTTDHTAYLSGYPGGTFGPDNSMTRAEVAQMFYALLLNKDVTITKSFSDVPANAWYATAVNTLASLGMVSGDPDGTFRPNDPITRAEFCVIALAFAYEPDNAVCYFGDVSRSDWFYTYVAQAASYGWIGGYTNGNFGPNDQITRAQVTTIVNNMLGRAADRDYVIDHQADLVQFSDLTRTHWGYFQIMEATNAHDYTKSGNTEDWTQLN